MQVAIINNKTNGGSRELSELTTTADSLPIPTNSSKRILMPARIVGMFKADIGCQYFKCEFQFSVSVEDIFTVDLGCY